MIDDGRKACESMHEKNICMEKKRLSVGHRGACVICTPRSGLWQKPRTGW